MLLEQYQAIQIPWVLEYSQLITAGFYTLLIVGGVTAAAGLVMLVVSLIRRKGSILLHLAAILLGSMAVLSGFWLQFESENSDTLAKYEREVDKLVSDRAMEKYGVAFADPVTAEHLTSGVASMRTGIGARVSIEVGFTKDGDLILLDEGGTELPKT